MLASDETLQREIHLGRNKQTNVGLNTGQVHTLEQGF